VPSAERPDPERRWPRSVYAVGDEPDPRFTFANERTFLAWIRTGLAFLTAGVALTTVAGLLPGRELLAHVAAAVLVVCGVLSGVVALVRWGRNERALRLQRPLPSSPAMLLVTGTLVVVAVIAVVVLL
jgi:putative membrane protein